MPIKIKTYTTLCFVLFIILFSEHFFSEAVESATSVQGSHILEHNGHLHFLLPVILPSSTNPKKCLAFWLCLVCLWGLLLLNIISGVLQLIPVSLLRMMLKLAFLCCSCDTGIMGFSQNLSKSILWEPLVNYIGSSSPAGILLCCQCPLCWCPASVEEKRKQCDCNAEGWREGLEFTVTEGKDLRGEYEKERWFERKSIMQLTFIFMTA